MIKKSTMKKFERLQNMPITSEHLDEERGIAWHQQMGILVGDWLQMIHNYCEERGRTYLFTTNEWGMPCIWFDVGTVKELHAKQKKEREKAKKGNKIDFLNPRIRKPN
mgnify:CR=1 FL=1